MKKCGCRWDTRPDRIIFCQLHAVAPELLEALKLIESVYRQNCVSPGEPSSVLETLQAAIAHAEPKP